MSNLLGFRKFPSFCCGLKNVIEIPHILHRLICLNDSCNFRQCTFPSIRAYLNYNEHRAERMSFHFGNLSSRISSMIPEGLQFGITSGRSLINKEQRVIASFKSRRKKVVNAIQSFGFYLVFCHPLVFRLIERVGKVSSD